jgi:hypothetical protein
MHFAVDSAGRAACGAIDTAGASPWRQYVTCGDCLAELDVAEAVNLVPTDPGGLADTLADLEAEFPDDGPAIACTQVHEHDEVACAAPTVAELKLETVGAQLADLYARIGGVFEDEADTAIALSRVADRIEQLLGELGVPVPAAASVPSATCPVCGARLSFNRWGEHSAAWVAEHAAEREAWVVKVFGPDDRLRAYAEWEQGAAVGYAAGKAA